jgi:DNA-directed RNA polymerase specialized sigma24 family protein
MAIGDIRYALWVADKDETGESVDPQFVKAAYVLEPSLFKYRRREIACESTAANLVQATVNAASRASHCKPIQNPIGYFFTAFTRRVDRYLATAKIEVSVEDDFIDDLSIQAFNVPAAKILENRILLDQLRSFMDEWTRMVCNMRLMGFSNDEIAKDLNLPVNRVAVRYSRGLNKAAGRLLSSSSNERKSRG